MIVVKAHPTAKAEKEYALQVLLGSHVGLSYALEWDDAVTGYHFLLENGGKLVLSDVFFANYKENYLQHSALPAAPVVFGENTHLPFSSYVFYGNTAFFQEKNSINFGGDIVATAFFLLSRWEETLQLPEVADAHGRFPSKYAYLVRHRLHQIPILDGLSSALLHWLQLLGYRGYAKKWPDTTQLSCDVDHPRLWSATHPVWRGFQKAKTILGALWLRRDWAECTYWWHWPLNTSDPYDTCGDLMDASEKNGLPPVQFFFLAAEKNTPDCLYSLERPDVHDLLHDIRKRGHHIGLHPSRAAHTCERTTQAEANNLERLGFSVKMSRQHYLCQAIPSTWRVLVSAGIQEDYSLGYTDLAGFRAGTARPFPAFDVLEKKQLPLLIHPLVVMDVALALHQKLQPEDLEVEMAKIHKEIRRHGGTFSILWHNSSIHTYFWASFASVLWKCLKEK